MIENAPTQNPAGPACLLPRRFHPFAAALWVVILILNFGFLGRHSLSNNEFITLDVLNLPLGRIVAERLSRNHMPLYFLFLKVWSQWFGLSEFALRLPSAVFSVLAIFFIWRLAAHLHGPRPALLALAFAGFNQTFLERGSDARMYSCLLFCAACSLWAFILFLDTGRRRYALYLALAGLLGLSVQLLYLFVTAFCLIFILVNRRGLSGGRRVPWSIAALLAPLLALSPLILWWGRVENKVGRSGWSAPQFSRALRQLTPMFIGDRHYDGQGVTRTLATIAVFAVLLLAIHAWLTFRYASRAYGIDAAQSLPGLQGLASQGVYPQVRAIGDPRRYLGFFIVWSVAPVLLIALAALKSDEQFVGASRYYVTTAAATPLVALAAIAHLKLLLGSRNKWLPCVFCGALIFLALFASVGFIRYPGPGLRQVSHHIAQGWQTGDRILTSSHHNRSAAFEYYDGIKAEPLEKPDGMDDPDQILAWLRASSAGARRVWMVYYDVPSKTFMQTLHGHAELLAPREKPLQVGETGVQLFDVLAPTSTTLSPRMP